MTTTQQPIAIVESGLVCSVGLNAPAACAAIRAAITNHAETDFTDRSGKNIIGASVPLDAPWRGHTKLIKMLAMAVRECVDVDNIKLPSLPLLLCTAELNRSGRFDGLDAALFNGLQNELSDQFHSTHSSIIAHGRIGAVFALAQARKLIYENNFPQVLIAAADNLLVGPTITSFEKQGRLLTGKNSNGFIPGQAASAILVSRPTAANNPQLVCIGIGGAMENSTIDAELPLRAEGLRQAINNALTDAQCDMGRMDFRITDISGEQYYFKEAALALSRTLRQRKDAFDIWHPADCIGEVGAAIGPAMMAVALAACRKGYAVGNNILCHSSNDAGQRAAAVLQYGL